MQGRESGSSPLGKRKTRAIASRGLLVFDSTNEWKSFVWRRVSSRRWTDRQTITSNDDCLLRQPVQDHADPDKLKTILTALPDIWAEQFVDKPKADLSEYGLKDPQ